MLDRMKEDYNGVLQHQKIEFGEKFKKIFVDVQKMENYLKNVRCKNTDIVGRLAPIISSSVVVNSPEIIEAIIEEMIEEQIEVLNQIESIGEGNKLLVEQKIKKNRLKKKIKSYSLLGAWDLIEKLEGYKNDDAVCED